MKWLGVQPPARALWSPTGALIPQASPRNGLARGVRIAEYPAASLSTPGEVARALHEIWITLRDVGAHALANPVGSSVLVQNVSVTSGVTVLVQHGLGRAITTWAVFRPRPAPGASPANGINLYEVNPQPSGIDPTKQVQLMATATGTVDLLFA